MPLDPESLLQIEDVLRRVLGLDQQPAAAARKLTVEEFAVCIQRSTEFVRRKIRGRVIPKDCVQGKPYLIHAKALAAFGVTPVMAAARLRETKQPASGAPSQPSPASTCDKAVPQLP